MANVQNSGQISMTDIINVWGGSAPHGLSEYYGKDTAPNSGEISFSDFYGTQPGYGEAQTPTSYVIRNSSGNYSVSNASGDNVTYVELYGGGGGGHWGKWGGNGGHGWGIISRKDIGNNVNTVYVTCGASGGISGTGGATDFGNYMRANGGIGVSGNNANNTTNGNFVVYTGNQVNSQPSWDNQNPSNDGTQAYGGNQPQSGGAVIYY